MAGHSVLIQSFIVNLLLTIGAFSVLLIRLRHLYQQQKLSYIGFVLCVLVVAVFGFELADYIVVAILLLVEEDIRKPKQPPVLLLTAVGLLALLSLVKFSYVAISVCFLVVLPILYVIRRDWLRLSVVWLGYCFCFVGLWLLSGQNGGTIPAYLLNGFEIAGGYSEAMNYPLWDSSSALFINMANAGFLGIGLLVLLLMLTYSLFGIRRTGAAVFALLSGPIVFLSFKEGFVRLDPDHMAFFYSQILLLLIAWLIVGIQQGFELTSKPILLLLSAGFIVCCIAQPARIAGLWNSLNLLHESNRHQTSQLQKKQLLTEYNVQPQHAQLIRRSMSSDIIPFNISLLYAMEATWNPRPVIQSYSAYTSALTQLNGHHFSGPKAPGMVWFSFQSIDNRYPPADDPAVYLALRSYYEPVAQQANSYLLLRHRSTPVPYPAETIGQVNHTLTNWVQVPTRPSKATFLKAEIKLTVLGELMNLFFKIPPLQLDLQMARSAPVRHRVIRRTLADEVLISDYLSDSNDVGKFLRGQRTKPILRFRLVGPAWYYRSVFPVDLLPADARDRFYRRRAHSSQLCRT